MKSERGVTLTSIMIYVIALTTTVIVVGAMITYFYKNIKYVSSNTAANAEFTKFNVFFTDDINVEGNNIKTWDTQDLNYIVFSKTGNQYTFKDGGIYLNKAKICKDIDTCVFSYDDNTKNIYVDMVIQGKSFSMTYTVVK